jgi:hypothetical protein
MKKIATLTAAAIFAVSPAFAGNLSGAVEEADPFVAEDPQGSGISPLIIGLGAAAVIGAIILISDSGSSSSGTTAPLN